MRVSEQQPDRPGMGDEGSIEGWVCFVLPCSARQALACPGVPSPRVSPVPLQLGWSAWDADRWRVGSAVVIPGEALAYFISRFKSIMRPHWWLSVYHWSILFGWKEVRSHGTLKHWFVLFCLLALLHKGSGVTLGSCLLQSCLGVVWEQERLWIGNMSAVNVFMFVLPVLNMMGAGRKVSMPTLSSFSLHIPLVGGLSSCSPTS